MILGLPVLSSSMKTQNFIKTTFVLIALLAALFSVESRAQGASHAFDVEILHQGKDVIWGFDFVDAETLIFTERGGAMKKLSLKSKMPTAISGVPTVYARGQGGLLDVRVREKNKIYFSYSEPVGGKATTVLAIADLEGNTLKNLKKVFVGHEPSSKQIHFGSRIEFDGKGFMYFSMGDRDDRHRAQKLDFNNGKIMRLKEDGSLPDDNPFVKTASARPEIWSYGHRNPQGLAWNPKTQELWEAEYGPRGGDELNLIQPGRNYGWPVITYGREYWGPSIGEGTVKAGMEQPNAHWVPSISPSGIGFYFGTRFPNWNGNLFFANLSSTHLRRLTIEGQKVTGQEELLKDKGWRFRHVRQGPDELIYFSTDEGRIGRLVPKK